MSDSFAKHPIVFYNVENLFDTVDDRHTHNDEEFTPEGEKMWDDERYQHKLDAIAEALLMANGKSPLAFGLAEIENRKVVEDLILKTALSSTDYRIVHYDSEDRRGVDSAFVYDASLLQTTIETKHVVSVEDEPHFRTRDILYIQGKIAEHEIHFFVNHWPSRREGTSESADRRNSAAQILRREIDEILNFNENANIVVMGDFNDTPSDISIREILRAKGQHEQQQGDLVNLLVEEHNKGQGTVVHQREWMVFDHIIVSQGLLQGQSGLEIERNNAFIVRNDALIYTYPDGNQKPNATYRGDTYDGGYSDHLPVYLTLKKA